MKITKKLGVVLLLLILIGGLAGCAEALGWLFPLTIQERLGAFAVTLNSSERDATDILLNFGSATTMTDYDNAKYLTYWEDAFPAVNEYVFSVEDATDTTAVAVEVTIIASSGGELFRTYTFKMYEEASGNWLIDEITDGADPVFRKLDFK
jgi:hypothetical protein